MMGINKTISAMTKGSRARRPALVLLTAFLEMGCALPNRTPVYKEQLRLDLALARGNLRPGEAVIAQATLTNVSGCAAQVRQLNGESVSFYWFALNSDERLQKRPTISSLEDMTQAVDLAPSESLKRAFVFTDATPAPGAFYLQAIYRTSSMDKHDSPMTVSPAMEFHVTGERRFHRGGDGLISKEDAIALARARAGWPTSEGKAVLVRNEAGFFDWFVCLTVSPGNAKQAAPERKAYFINPYLGEVRAEADPALEKSLFAVSAADSSTSEKLNSNHMKGDAHAQ